MDEVEIDMVSLRNSKEHCYRRLAKSFFKSRFDYVHRMIKVRFLAAACSVHATHLSAV